MPRIRSLKPEHPRNRKIGKLSDRAYRLWASLVGQADDEGRRIWDPEEFRVLIWGYQARVRETHIQAAMQEVLERGLCMVYQSNGQIYYELHDWADHQRIDHPVPSVLPSMASSGSELITNIRDSSRGVATPRSDLDGGSITLSSSTQSKSFPQNDILQCKIASSTPEQVAAAQNTKQRAADAKALLDFWFQEYRRLFSQPPQVDGARDMLAAKAILGGRSLEQATAIVQFHLQHPSPFYAERKLFGIHHIRKDCNQIIARMSSPTAMELPKGTRQTLDAVKRWKELGHASRK